MNQYSCQWCKTPVTYGGIYNSSKKFCSPKCEHDSEQAKIYKERMANEERERKKNEPTKPLGFFGWIFIIFIIYLLLEEFLKTT